MKSLTQKVADIVMVAVTLILMAVFWSITYEPAEAQLQPCHSGYWGIDSVVTASAFDEYGPFPATGMGMQVEQVTDDLYVGTFFLNDDWLTFEFDNEGGGVLRTTQFGAGVESFKGRAVDNGMAYFIPQIGEAGFSREIPEMWACLLSDQCFREFAITQLTFPQGACEE